MVQVDHAVCSHHSDWLKLGRTVISIKKKKKEKRLLSLFQAEVKMVFFFHLPSFVCVCG